jgi:methylenetetrahydrofolate reductase (NADPH)
MISLELNPPSRPSLDEIYEKIRKYNSFDAFIITELAMRREEDRWMDTMYTAIKLKEATGKRIIPVMTSRESTKRGILSRILMAIHGGIDELVIVRGDQSPYGGAFGMTTVEIIRTIRSLCERFSKRVTVYVAANPTRDLEGEIVRAAEKLSSGADAVITQPTLDTNLLRKFIAGLRERGFDNPVIGSIMILNSRNSAEIMERRCGIRFPEWFKEELERGNWRDSLLTSIREIADICDGVHISPIVEQDFSVLLAEEARKILRDRDEQLPIFLP